MAKSNSGDMREWDATFNGASNVVQAPSWFLARHLGAKAHGADPTDVVVVPHVKALPPKKARE